MAGAAGDNAGVMVVRRQPGFKETILSQQCSNYVQAQMSLFAVKAQLQKGRSRLTTFLGLGKGQPLGLICGHQLGGNSYV